MPPATARRAGRTPPAARSGSRAAASGSRPLGLQQEVEGRRRPRRARAARRSSARSRSGPRARRPSRRARSPVVPPTIVSSIDPPLEACRARSVPPRPTGRTTSASISSSKYHLWTNSSYSGRAAARGRPRRCPAGDPHAVGDRDPDQAEHGAEHQPEHQQPAAFVRRVQRRVGEGRAQEVVDHEVGFRDLHEPGADARRRRAGSSPRASAARARRSRGWGRGSRRRCPRLRRSRGCAGTVGVVQVARFELARLRHRLAVEGAEDHPERVDARSGTRRRSRPRRAPSASRRARPVTSRISSLEKKPENGGMPDSARPPIRKQRVGERQRLAEAAHPVERLLAGHRADDRAGAP